MSFSTELLELMPSTCTVSTRTGHSQWGQPTFSTASVSYRCRIVEKPGYVRGADSEEIAYRHVAWVRSTSTGTITVSDRITLPGGATPEVVAVERYSDEDGPHHVKVMFGY